LVIRRQRFGIGAGVVILLKRESSLWFLHVK